MRVFRNSQRGISLSGLIFVVAIVGVLVVFGMRTVSYRRNNRTGGRLTKSFLIKIMLPQKNEFAKLFICTLKFHREIK